MKNSLCVVAIALPLVTNSGEFENLGFDDGYIPPNPTNSQWIPLSGLPDWRPQIDGKDIDRIGWNVLPQATAIVSIISGSEFQPFQEGVGALFLQGGLPEGAGNSELSASIDQIGVIPSGANSLLFRGVFGLGSEVQINGVAQSIVDFGSVQYGPRKNVYIYGVDVSKYSGREIDLKLVANSTRTGYSVSMAVDSLRFSAQSIPEPSTGILLGIGALLITCAGGKGGGKGVRSIPLTSGIGCRAVGGAMGSDLSL